MRIVVQRVAEARVTVAGETVGEIGRGLAVLLGVGAADTEKDARTLAEKAVNLRIFEDEAGKMNRSLLDTGGDILVVSQFTLFGDCRKGRRPSYASAAPPEMAERLYRRFVEELRTFGLAPATGIFQAMMQVELVNDGPVTILLDSEKLF